MAAACAILAGMAAGCGSGSAVDVTSGVALDLAERRASTIFNVLYDLRLAIPEERDQPIGGSVTTSFTLTEVGPLIFDFAQPADSVHAVRVAGDPVVFEVRNEHVIVPVEAVSPGHNVVTSSSRRATGRSTGRTTSSIPCSCPTGRALPFRSSTSRTSRRGSACSSTCRRRGGRSPTARSPRGGARGPGRRRLHRDPHDQQLPVRLRGGRLPGRGSRARRAADGDVPPRDRPRAGRAQRRRPVRPARVGPGVAGGVHRHPVPVREVRLRAGAGLPVRRDGAPGGDLLPRRFAAARRERHAERVSGKSQSHRPRDRPHVVRGPGHHAVVRRRLDEGDVRQLPGREDRQPGVSGGRPRPAVPAGPPPGRVRRRPHRGRQPHPAAARQPERGGHALRGHHLPEGAHRLRAPGAADREDVLRDGLREYLEAHAYANASGRI